MSVTMAKADGVTVFTVTSDPQSTCPPLCQIIKGLCYSPVCYSVSQHLRRAQRTSQSLLGTLHIMVGLLNIAFGAILLFTEGAWWQMQATWFPVWLGVAFIAFGTVCILSEKYPSPCLVILNVILNLAGVAFAIAAVILYAINIYVIDIWWSCRNYDNWHYRSRPTPAPTPSAEEKMLVERCYEGKALALILLRSINAVLIILSVLELCLTISSAVLGIKTLKSRGKEQDMIPENVEKHKPLLEEGTTNPTA